MNPRLSVAALVAIPVCMLWVDRPLALLCFREFGNPSFRGGLDYHTVAFFECVAILLIAICRIRSSLLAVAAAVVSLGVTIGLKYLIGRSCPDPVFLHLHQYGFHPFSTDVRWTSFPSGTIGAWAAVSTVLARSEPRLRLAAPIFTGLLCILIVLENAHWLSDVLAGALLGVFLGRQTLRLLAPALILKADSCV